MFGHRVICYKYIKNATRKCLKSHRRVILERLQICEISSEASHNEKQKVIWDKISQKYPLVYNSSEVEKGWYEWWQQSGYFQSQASTNNKVFSMILPPPNITGTLHLGHALTVAIQDVLVRWYRMRGKYSLKQNIDSHESRAFFKS